MDADGAIDERARCVRRSRVVLTPRCWRQARRSLFPASDGDNEPGPTGESTKQAVKPLRREGRDAPPVPVCSCAVFCCVHLAYETAGAASTRSSLSPSCFDGGQTKMQTSGDPRRENAKPFFVGWVSLRSTHPTGLTFSRHRPRMRTIQYSGDSNDQSKGRGVLDAPPSRGTTSPGKWPDLSCAAPAGP